MSDRVEELKSIPANSNPYHHDLDNMGQAFSKEWQMMFKNHSSEPADWVIFVHLPTGRRFKIHLSKLIEWPF